MRVSAPHDDGPAEGGETIAQAGAGDPAAVAAGISQALITTASGLIVAIPTIVFHRFLSARAEKAFKEKRI